MMKYSKKIDKKKKYLNTIKINKMQKGFYNRVMTSNRVLNSSKSQPVIQPAKINNGDKLKYVSEDVEKVDFVNEVKESVSFSSIVLENRINNLESVINDLLSKNVEIENKLKELQLLNFKQEIQEKVVEEQVLNNVVEEQVVEKQPFAHFELKEFDTIISEAE